MGDDDFRKGYDFSGRTIVMTGGTGVLGSEMAVALARAGQRGDPGARSIAGRRVERASCGRARKRDPGSCGLFKDCRSIY
jgi:NAD(P)-dependent dehydrogenase (short-subunit alcohol dehydrogenase family)